MLPPPPLPSPLGMAVVSDETTASTTVAAASITTALATAAASSSTARVMKTVTAMASAVATAAIAAPQTAIAVSEPQGECRLLGSFALIIQAVLGGLALLSLVFKRWRERPQRPVKIWFFDVSKQVFGSVLVHVANIFMSMLTSGRFSIKLDPAVTQRLPMARDSDSDYTPNPCSFYLLNLAIDTTLGIPILIILLRILTGLAALTPFGDPPDSIRSGNYGSPPNAGWWLKQSILYFCGLFAMKLCILLIFILMPWISQIGDWALGWTARNERLQIAFVMMIFPLVMNALQYYIIDSFIKQSEPSQERLPSRDPDETRLRYDAATRLAGRPRHVTAHGVDLNDDDDDDDSIGPLVNMTPSARLPVRSRLTLGGEYDPEVDGNAPTVIGSTSSRHLERNSKFPPPEFFPKE